MNNDPTIPLPQRLNGLTPPYSGPQIAALIAFVLTILEYAIVVAPSLHYCAIAPVSLVFIGIICSVINFGAKALSTDPMDIHVIEHLRQQNRLPTACCTPCDNNPKLTRLEQIYVFFNQDRHETFRLPQETMKQCWICDLQVADHSMHCKFCNKCVYKFDHHCMWLNTCIGQANYRQFYRLMWALIVMEIVHLGLHIYLILDIFLDGTFSSPYQSKIALSVIFFFFLLFNVVSIILIGQLIVFHMKLQKKRLTTYAYIIQEHKEKRELARRLGDLEAKRIALIDESRGLQKCFLQMGGFCRSIGVTMLDPLELPPVYTPDPEAGFASAIGPPRTTELASIAPRETPAAPLAENDEPHEDDEVEDFVNADAQNDSSSQPQNDSSSEPLDSQQPPAMPLETTNGGTTTTTPVAEEPSDRSGRDWDDSMTASVIPEDFENEPLGDLSHHSSSRHRSENVERLQSC